MQSDSPLPPTMADWARRQATSGVRYTTAAALWQAADQAHPGVLPPDPRPISRDWPINRDLIHAYVSGLPPIEVGDLVQLVHEHTGATSRGVVTIIHDPASVRVRLDSPGKPEVDTGRMGVEPVPVVFYTASIITLDGSDTNAYGEPCEPGRGYTEQSGWWDPDRSYWRVCEHRRDVTPDVYPPDEPRSPARWLADRLTARLGSLESFDGGRTFYGAREAVHPGRLTGTRSQAPGAVIGGGSVFGDALAASRLRQAPPGIKTLTAAAHAHGFTEQQLTDVYTLAGRHPDVGVHHGDNRRQPTE